MITSWPPENPASTLKPGETFTLKGVYQRRRDWFSRFVGVFGWERYTDRLQTFRVTGSAAAIETGAYIEYEETPEPGIP